ncbi:hypothetical protein N7539_008428 [Penicillium diatomitis]|uniref:Uncharacterized protein n=1 Tax=Penicillium diatomitis TaxID=2819901 RepID=A0A9X0BNM0_9EURO|nr:uncharacterized protein N7539_008428 [Penicillium diatomitis]KAJ5475362.1 hypothetical protein N7539_008428 [Penicillium diatomitis]
MSRWNHILTAQEQVTDQTGKELSSTNRPLQYGAQIQYLGSRPYMQRRRGDGWWNLAIKPMYPYKIANYSFSTEAVLSQYATPQL